MATANPIKLPVVITADGTQAQAGFAKLRTSMQSLERGFGRYLTRQASALTGMVTGFFTVDALFSGIQKFLAHGAEVNERIAQFSPEVMKAQAQLQGAQLRQDVALAYQVGPQIAEQTKRQQAALPTDAVFDAAASGAAVGIKDLWLFVKEQTVAAMTGDVMSLPGNAARYYGEGLGLIEEDPLAEMERKLQEAQALAPLATPNVPFEKQSKEVQESAEAINLLREQVQELRGLNRQLGAN